MAAGRLDQAVMSLLLVLVLVASLLPARVAAQDSPGDKCSMCEYVMESVDRAVKAKPRMIGGGGYYPGVMDFGGGLQKGNYRVYPGSYLETSEKEGQHHRRGELASLRTHRNTKQQRRLHHKQRRTQSLRKDIAKKEAPPRSSSSSSSSSAKPAWYGRRRQSRRQRHPGDLRPPLNGVWGRNADHLRAFGQQRFRAVESAPPGSGEPDAAAGAGSADKSSQDGASGASSSSDDSSGDGSSAEQSESSDNGSSAEQGESGGVDAASFPSPLDSSSDTGSTDISSLLETAQRSKASEPDTDTHRSADDPLSAGNELDGVYQDMHGYSNRKYDVTPEGNGGSGVGRGSDGLPRFASRDGSNGPTSQSNKIKPRESKRTPVGGKFGFMAKDRFDNEAEKGDEYAGMYKNFMDAMDDVCYRDMPKPWLSGCKDLYEKGDQLVEMYLHDYDDWEICNEIQPDCKSAKMFEMVCPPSC